MNSKEKTLNAVRVDIDEASRLFALKKYESASDLLASALESLRDEYGEDAPELAPILHQYGRALLEHVISTSSALGGGGTVENDESDAVCAGAMKKNDARFSFEGDGDESDEEAVPSLGKRKANDIDNEDNDNQNDEEEDDDDMGVVFSVLDLARVLYGHILDGTSSQVSSSKGKSASRCELKLITGEVWDRKAIETDLAEVRNDLGDVGLETENFEQASTDYEASLNLLKPLLSPYSRRLSDANLRLGLALEFHPDPEQRSRALDYIEQAANVLKRRLVELSKASESKNADSKDQTDDSLSLLDEDQVKRETKDVQELLQDLEVKIDEMKASPSMSLKDDGKPSNPVLEQAIKEAFLGAASAAFSSTPATSSSQPVNDLSARVKRKKKQ